MIPNAIIARYSEVFLKGGRRRYFLKILKENLALQVSRVGPYRVKEAHGFLIVCAKNGAGFQPIEASHELLEAIARTFGIVSFSPCLLVPKEISVIEREVAKIAVEDIAGKASFKIDAARSDKNFPLDSMELNRRLGAIVQGRTKVPVRLRDPEITLYCHILHEYAALYFEVRKGPGGLPVGCSGKVLLLLSGGIDSPVAGWLAMRRGCELDAVHFEALPYTTLQARQKAIETAQILAHYQRSMSLFIVPFGAIQATLRDQAPGRLLVVLYRRMMLRIATRLAAICGAQAIVTGDNLGQVASQTLPNLSLIEKAAGLPVLRPLLTYDKSETIALARRIGTYEISIRPYDDCCSLFVPAHPEVAASPESVAKVEERLEVEQMLSESIAGVEKIDLL